MRYVRQAIGYVLVVCAVLLLDMLFGPYLVDVVGFILPDSWVAVLRGVLLLVASASTAYLGVRIVLDGRGGK